MIVTEDQTTILGGAGTAGDGAARLTQIRAELARVENDRDHDHLSERLGRLAGRVAVIEVGAATGVELKERRRQTEGALAATRAAIAEGVLPGGGIALANAERALDASPVGHEQQLGDGVVRASLWEPLRLIADNAGHDPHAVAQRIQGLPSGWGLDVMTGQYCDMLPAGVIDAAKVTRSALRNAASVAALMLTTEALVVEELVAQPGAVIAPGFGDLADGLPRPSPAPGASG